MLDDPRPSKQLPSIELAILSDHVLEALIAGSIERASDAFGRSLPEFLLEDTWLWNYRLAQLRDDPSTGPWLVRVVIDTATGDIVGHAGFHGPPDERGMVEVGYSTNLNYRRRGFATAALGALIDFAAADPTAHIVRASVSPENRASLNTISAYGFTYAGEQEDEIDGLEYIFERPLR